MPFDDGLRNQMGGSEDEISLDFDETPGIVETGIQGRCGGEPEALKEIEEALRRSEERYRLLTEHLQVGVYLLHGTRVTYINPAVSRIMGYTPDEIYAQPTFEVFIHPDDRGLVMLNLKRRIEGDAGRGTYTFRCVRKDGEIRHLLNDSVLLDEGPEMLVLGHVIDVTDQLKAEEALRQSENTYRALIEGLQAGIAFFGSNKVMYINPAFERLLGYSLDEINRIEDLFMLIHPDDLPGALDKLQAHRRGNTEDAPYELRIIRRDGEIRHILGTAEVIEHKGKPAVIANVIDVTDQRKAQQALEESEEMFRLIGESSADILILSINEKFIYVNPTLCRVTGYDEEELLSGQVDVYSLVAPELRDEIRQRHKRRLLGKDEPSNYETDIITKHGERRTLEVRIATFSFRGRVASLINAHDITERLQIQQKLLAAAKAESVQRLAGGIAHDFNNLLVAIMGNASMLKSDPGIDAGLSKALDQIETAARQAAGLTGQLLAYARGGRYQPAVLNPAQLVEQTLPLLHASLGPAVEIKTVFENNIPSIKADRSQTEQVLMNLGLNSGEAMSMKGELRISIDQVHDLDKPLVRICFEDTGPGVPRSVREKIFDPFFSTKGPGRGMGMAAVYGIMQNHGGTIEMENLPKRGARFTLTFPAVAASPGDVFPDHLSPRNGAETILIVDDDEMILDVAGTILAGRGYGVVTALGGQRALAELEHRDDIDLVIIDMVMPGMGGEETCEKIKMMYPVIKVIFSSGYDDPGCKKSQRRADGFIQKPYTVAQLTSKIREVLDGGSTP